jgi:2-polyprenyl-6-hydroxyphenyl methylase / 3-demethylubiquinone-9 3-methyltransferase
MKGGIISMEQKELAGGSYHWWPPRDDRIILFKLNPVRFEFFDGFIPAWDGVSVLDVGCGGGYACEYLTGRGAVVHGTDLLKESLAEAQLHAKENILEIDYRLCSIERLPFDNDSADVVTCFDVLEHVQDKPRLLSEIHRDLKPGGWFFLDTFTKSFWSRLVIIWLGEIVFRFMPRGLHDWRLFINPSGLQRLLTTTGFGIGEFAGIRPARRRLPGSLPARVFPGASKVILYFAAVRKPIK